MALGELLVGNQDNSILALLGVTGKRTKVNLQPGRAGTQEICDQSPEGKCPHGS